MAWTTPAAQSKDTQFTTSTSSPSATFSSNTTTGNAIFFLIVLNANASVNSVSITSGGSANFNRIGAKVSGTHACEMWAAGNINGGTTPTIQAQLSASTTGEIVMYEFAGPPGINMDGSVVTNSGTGTAPTSGSFTTTVNSDLLVKVIYCAGTASTPETSWTDICPTTGGNETGYVVKGTAGSTNASCNQTSSSAWIVVAAAFQPTSNVNMGTATMGAKAGLSAAKVSALLSGTVGAKSGITSSAIVTSNSATMGAHAGLSQAKPTVVLSSTMGARAGLSSNHLSVVLSSTFGARAGIQSVRMVTLLSALFRARAGISSATLTVISGQTADLTNVVCVTLQLYPWGNYALLAPVAATQQLNPIGTGPIKI